MGFFKGLEIIIFKALRESGVISRAEIARKTGVSKPIVSHVIKKWIDLGAVEEKQFGESSKRGGKRPIMLSFIPDFRNIIGIDVGGNKIISILTDLDGAILKKEFFPSRDIDSEAMLVKRIVEAAEAVMPEDRNKILGIGIGVPGTADYSRGFVHFLPSFNLKNIKLKEILEQNFSAPVLVSNDVTLNAMGETWRGAAGDSDNIALISLGTGTGVGFIFNRKVFCGSNYMAGEIGNMITDWTVEKNLKMETFGTLESWFSGNAFEKKAKELAGLEISGKEFFELIEKNDVIKRIFSEGCEHLALALGNLISLLDPETVVFSGGIGFNRFDEIMEKILPLLERTVPGEILKNISFKKGTLGELGVAVGAVNLIHNDLFIED